MKILIVGPATSPIIQRLSHFLKQQGVIVKVASFNVPNGEADFDLGELKGFKSYFNVGRLNQVIKQFDPDVIHAHVINHYGLMASLTAKPVLLAAWGSDVLLANKSGNRIKDFVFTLFNRWGVKQADKLHTSSANVSSALVKEFNCDADKVSTFYWGFPLVPAAQEQDIAKQLESEFGLIGDGFIVFNRGLGQLYNPATCAKIVNDLAAQNRQHKLVVFKGFAADSELLAFKQLVGDNAIIIDRLLNDSELHWIYQRTRAHFSIPKSDALGGGVIEPALLGSLPILSDLSQYHQYLENNPGMIYNEQSHDAIIAKLSTNEVQNSSEHVPLQQYHGDSIVKRFISLYQELMK